MATHGEPGSGTTPRVVPFELPELTRLSWELGSRVIDDEESVRLGAWERTETSWSLSIHRVTSETVVMRLRTPAGRERFYGAAEMDLQSALPEFRASPQWRKRG